MARAECAIEPSVGTSLFDRQLAAAGLEHIADRIAASTFLELDDAVQLSRASLPLLGRIVQLRSSPEGGAFDSADMPVESVATTADLPRQIAQPLTDWDAYCRRLIALRDELAASSEPAAWYPQVNRTPDENASSDNDYTGVEVLRAIALARLALPENVQIVAPLAALGAKLAQVALDFGASHLGFIACDGQPLEGPLAVNVDELKELRQSCPPTAMEEAT